MLDTNQIKNIIPHREPFLFIDKILNIDNKCVVALKKVKKDESYFKGHFPDKKIMPGVIIMEAMAQAAAVLILSQIPHQERKNQLFVFNKIVQASFKQPVNPGDELKLTVELIKLISKGAFVSAKAEVKERIVATAELLFGRISR